MNILVSGKTTREKVGGPAITTTMIFTLESGAKIAGTALENSSSTSTSGIKVNGETTKKRAKEF